MTNVPPLSIFSWNTLADWCCNGDDQGFPYVPEAARDPKTRAAKQLEHILASNADIIALQEVDLPERFEKPLQDAGYQVLYRRRSRSPLGLLFAVKKSALSIDVKLEFNLGDDRIALGYVVTYADTMLVICTVHLKAKAHGADVRTQQIEKLVQLNAAFTNIIIAGDFNDLPESDCIARLQQSGLEMVQGPTGVPELTTCKMRKTSTGEREMQRKTEDYIFYHTTDIKPIAPLVLATPEIPEVGLPSVEFPSDHLSLMATFACVSQYPSRPEASVESEKPCPKCKRLVDLAVVEDALARYFCVACGDDFDVAVSQSNPVRLPLEYQ